MINIMQQHLNYKIGSDQSSSNAVRIPTAVAGPLGANINRDYPPIQFVRSNLVPPHMQQRGILPNLGSSTLSLSLQQHPMSEPAAKGKKLQVFKFSVINASINWKSRKRCNYFMKDGKAAHRCPEYKARGKKLEEVIEKIGDFRDNCDHFIPAWKEAVSFSESTIPKGYLRRNAKKFRMARPFYNQKRNEFNDLMREKPKQIQAKKYAENINFIHHLETFHGYDANDLICEPNALDSMLLPSPNVDRFSQDSERNFSRQTLPPFHPTKFESQLPSSRQLMLPPPHSRNGAPDRPQPSRPSSSRPPTQSYRELPNPSRSYSNQQQQQQMPPPSFHRHHSEQQPLSSNQQQRHQPSRSNPRPQQQMPPPLHSNYRPQNIPPSRSSSRSQNIPSSYSNSSSQRPQQSYSNYRQLTLPPPVPRPSSSRQQPPREVVLFESKSPAPSKRYNGPEISQISTSSSRRRPFQPLNHNGSNSFTGKFLKNLQ
uniref:Uncharacterized protein n=1 Tax=Panagrolaimus davidi TaxID=227884 RepID=A0A914PFT8_9BILA